MRWLLASVGVLAACTKGATLLAYNASPAALEVSVGDTKQGIEPGRAATFTGVEAGAALSVSKEGTLVDRLTVPKAERAQTYVFNALRGGRVMLVDYGPAYPCGGKGTLAPEKLTVIADLSENQLVGLAQAPLGRDERLPTALAECGKPIVRVEVAPKALGTGTLEEWFQDKLRREAALWPR